MKVRASRSPRLPLRGNPQAPRTAAGRAHSPEPIGNPRGSRTGPGSAEHRYIHNTALAPAVLRLRPPQPPATLSIAAVRILFDMVLLLSVAKGSVHHLGSLLSSVCAAAPPAELRGLTRASFLPPPPICLSQLRGGSYTPFFQFLPSGRFTARLHCPGAAGLTLRDGRRTPDHRRGVVPPRARTALKPRKSLIPEDTEPL